MTGNTVIDALLQVSSRRLPFSDARLSDLVASHRRLVLVTTHRRESWGDQMRQSMAAVRRLAQTYSAVEFVLPMRPNPVVREVVEPALGGLGNITLTEPLDYGQFAHLLAAAHLVLTDSGGVQEEAPSLGKPVLVMREDTERPEALDAVAAKLVGTNCEVIYSEVTALLEDPSAYSRMANAVNPYGDGCAAARAAAAIGAILGIGARLPEFPGSSF